MAGKKSYKSKRDRRKVPDGMPGGVNRGNWIWFLVSIDTLPFRAVFWSGRLDNNGVFFRDPTIIPEGTDVNAMRSAAHFALDEETIIEAESANLLGAGEVEFVFGDDPLGGEWISIYARRFFVLAPDGAFPTDYFRFYSVL